MIKSIAIHLLQRSNNKEMGNLYELSWGQQTSINLQRENMHEKWSRRSNRDDQGELKNLELQKEIHTTKTLCNGQCKHGPIAILYPQGTWYKELDKTKSKELIHKLKENDNVHLGSELYYHDGKTFKNQKSE